MVRKTLCLMVLVSCALTLSAQNDNLIERIKTSMKERQIRKDSLIRVGQPFLSVFAGPGYTPEAGLLLGGGLLYTFSTDSENPELQRSSIPLLGSISTRGNVGLNSSINTFWLEDKLRVKAQLKYSNVQDDYFGIGYETNQSITRGEETSRYNRVLLLVKPRVEARLIPNLFAGVSFTYSNLNIKDVNPIMAEDENFIEFGSDITETGFAFNVTYDSRDIVVNAYRGLFAEFIYYRPDEMFGGNQNYQVYEYDLRYYKTLTRPGNTLAFRAYGRQAIGEVPFSGMTLIGDTNLLRGYLNGQYRDKAGLALIAEWRYMFLKKNGLRGKNGIATWIGTGSIGENFGGFNYWLPNAGIGYRLELQPRMNLRIDVGIGKNSSGLYFNFSEAF